ncbi:VOC family protein [Pseudohalocynthiibacter aestuariivivens]|uniref:VOC family protein n=1 Tax=Roseovarius pelagicus TaxID=2980108 RepID=A0ABY6D9Y5_9RHOB|nr:MULTISPECIES: VOC family protein [Rhodobacterales]QIE45117.1 VOC family protein [Pseudohalocynthiibacter aestuariivivens]UXX82946.1 VOC family protein [Roseovarius pelagicus]
MDLGAFSISLAVKNLTRSRGFYEALGFAEAGGSPDQGWLILRNGDTVIGLFEGMFEGNILTFNPGWDQSGASKPAFSDIRTIEARLKKAGLKIERETGGGTGPASLILRDPDGNSVMLDQHVDAPDD